MIGSENHININPKLIESRAKIRRQNGVLFIVISPNFDNVDVKN